MLTGIENPPMPVEIFSEAEKEAIKRTRSELNKTLLFLGSLCIHTTEDIELIEKVSNHLLIKILAFKDAI